MKEWVRTIVLVLLLAVGVAYILWTHHAATTSLLQGITS